MAIEISEYDQFNSPEQTSQGSGVSKTNNKQTTPKVAKADNLSQYNDYAKPEYVGRSVDDVTEYDTGSTLGANVEDQRGRRQSGLEQAVHGTLKGAGLAATTFMHTFTALPVGIIGAMGKGLSGDGIQESASYIYDNPIAAKLDEFNKFLEEAMPNYYTDEQKKADTFSWANLGTANFVFDKLVKNAGFTVGAIGSGAVVAKGFAALGKIAMAKNIAAELKAVDNLVAAGMTHANAMKQVASGIRTVDAVTRMGSTIVAATTEGSIEALESKHLAKAAILKKIEEKNGMVTDLDIAEAEQSASAAGNAVLAANIAILGISDTIQFAKFFGGGFKREMAARAANVSKVDGKFIADAAQTGWKKNAGIAGRVAKYPATEAWEEGSQFTTSKGAVDYAERRYDEEGISAFDNLIRSTAKGLDETFGSKEGLESMLLGALTGMGSSVITGTAKSEFSKDSREFAQAEAVAKTLNEYAASDIFQSKKKATVRAKSIQKDMDHASVQGDAFLFKNLEHDLYKSYVQSRIETDRLDLLVEELNDLKQLPREEFLSMFGLDKSVSTEKSVSQYVDTLIGEARRMGRSWEDVQTRFPQASSGNKERLWSLLTNIGNRDERERTLALELYTATGISLNDEKNLDPKKYRDNFKAKIDAYEETDPTKGVSKKAEDLLKLVDDRIDMINSYKELITEEGQTKADKKAKKEETRRKIKEMVQQMPNPTAEQTESTEEEETTDEEEVEETEETGETEEEEDDDSTDEEEDDDSTDKEEEDDSTDEEEEEEEDDDKTKSKATPETDAAAQAMYDYVKNNGGTDADAIKMLTEARAQAEVQGNEAAVDSIDKILGQLRLNETEVTEGEDEDTEDEEEDEDDNEGEDLDVITKQIMAVLDANYGDNYGAILVDINNKLNSEEVPAEYKAALKQLLLHYAGLFKKQKDAKSQKAATPGTQPGEQLTLDLDIPGSGEQGPPVSDDENIHRFNNEMGELAATVFRSTGEHQKAIKEGILSIVRYQAYVHKHSQANHRARVVTMHTDEELYKVLLNKQQKAHHAVKDKSFAKAKVDGIMLVMVDTAGKFLVVDETGNVVESITRDEFIARYSTGIDMPGAGPAVTFLVNKTEGKESGFETISLIHYVRLNFGREVDSVEDVTKEELQHFINHKNKLKALRKQIMALPKGSLMQFTITGMGMGHENRDAHEDITLEEALNIKDINDTSLNWVVGTAGADRGFTSIGPKEGLTKRTQIKTGGVYIVKDGKLSKVQPRTLSPKEAGLVANLFYALSKKTDAKDIAVITSYIKSYIYLNENTARESARVYIDMAAGVVHFAGQTVKLSEANQSIEFIEFLQSKYRQVDQRRATENSLITPLKSVTSNGVLIYGPKVTYRDWLVNVSQGVKFMGVPMSKQKEGVPTHLNSYLEFSHSLEEFTPVPDKIEEVKEEKVEEAPAEEAPKPGRRQVTRRGGTPKGDNIFDRLEELRQGGETENFGELDSWFKSRFDGESFSISDKPLRRSSMGVYSVFGVVLWRGAEKGTGYHEAFHKVTQEYLSPKEVQTLYAEARKRLDKPNATDRQIEEILAEDFRQYVMSQGKTILGQSPKRNTIFRRLWKALKSWFTGTRTIQDVYEQLYSEKGFTGSKKKGVNALGTTDRSFQGMTELETREIVESVNYHFFKILFGSNLTPREIASSNVKGIITRKVYERAYQQLEDRFNDLADYYETIPDENTEELDRVNRIMDMYNFMFDNYWEQGTTKVRGQFTSVQEAHTDYLRGLGITISATEGEVKDEGITASETDKEEAIDSQLENNKGDESISRDATNGLKSANETNPMEVNSTAVKLLIASLPARQMDVKTGELYDVTNSMGVPQLIEFKRVYTTLLRGLAGTSTYEEMYEKMGQMSDLEPSIDDLRNRLGKPTTDSTMDQYILQKQFRQDFSKFESKGTITLVDPKTGVFYEEDANANRLTQKIKERWMNNLRKGDSPYTEITEQNFVTVDIEKKVNGLTILELADEDAYEFLKALGIEFTGYTKEEVEAQLDYQGIDFIRDTLEKMANEGETINNLFTKSADLIGRMNYLASIEAANTTEVVELSYISAEGKTIYAVTLNNYYSLIVNAINNANTRQELFANYPYLATAFSGNSVWMNAIFNEDGTRRNGTRLAMRTVSGMKNQDQIESGIAATRLEPGDKASQELNSLLIGGQASLIRAGDKATEYAFVIEGAPKGAYLNANKEPSKLPVPMGSVDTTFDTEEVKNIFMGYFYAELGRIRSFNDGLGTDIQIYNGKAMDWSLFADILTTAEKSRLAKYTKRNAEGKWLKVSEKDQKLVKAATIRYLEGYAVGQKESLFTGFTTMGIGRYSAVTDSYAGISKDLTHDLVDGNWIQRRGPREVIRNFAVNHLIQIVEQHKLMVGDPALYKDEFKRISGGTGTKKTASTGANDDAWLAANALRRDGKKPNSRVKTIIFADHVATSSMLTEYMDAMEAYYKRLAVDQKNPALEKSREELKEILSAYAKMEEGDAQAWITLDEYKEFFLRTGEWSETLEAQYQYEQALGVAPHLRTEEEHLLIKQGDPGHVIQPIKAQYFGPQVYDKLNAVTFHKYSLMPLIPRTVEGTNMENMLKDMMATQTGYAVFGSGVKLGARLDKRTNKLTPFYQNYIDTQITGITHASASQEIYYEFLGIQLDIAPKIKDKVIFGSQFRKLVLSNLFSRVPVDYVGETDWDMLTEAEKMRPAKDGGSDFYKIAQEYNKVERLLIDREFDKLVKELGLVYDKATDKYTQVDVQKLVQKLRTSSEERGMPDNIVDSIDFVTRIDGTKEIEEVIDVTKIVDGKEVKSKRRLKKTVANEVYELRYPIDSLVNRVKIENMLFSLVNAAVIKQKMNGEGMIQGASTGFEEINKRQIGKSNFLKTYTDKGPNGTTTKMEVMVPANGQYASLVEHYGSLKKLNAAIAKGEVDERLLTMVGYRIPTQGMNSIDVLVIKKFLPPSHGSLIIMPTEIVAKSGGDFDIDKLNVFRPNIKAFEKVTKNKKGEETTTTVISYVGYASIEDDKGLIAAFKGNKRALSGTALAAKIAEIESEHEKTYNRSMGQLKSRIAKSKAAIDAVYQQKLKDIPVTEEEQTMLDDFYNEYKLELRRLERALRDLDKTEEDSKPEADLIESQINQLKEDFRAEVKDLRKEARDYMLAPMTAEREARYERKKTRAKELTAAKNTAVANAIREALLDPTVDLSMETLHNSKALQNRLIELSIETILHPSNFVNLITPNTTKTLTNLVDDIRKARGESAPGPMSHTKIMRFDTILDQFKYFLGGKGGVGIGAVHTTSHTLFQMADVYLNNTYRDNKGTEKKFYLPLEHNTTDAAGDGYKRISMSGLRDRGGNLISDILSQFINAYVDVAKDPFYKDLNAGMATASVYFYLVRAGVDIKTAAYYMTQPIILEYIEAEALNKSLVLETAGLTKRDKIFDEEFNKLAEELGKKRVDLYNVQERGGSPAEIKEAKRKLAIAEQAMDNLYDSVRTKYIDKAFPGLDNYGKRQIKKGKDYRRPVGYWSQTTLLSHITAGAKDSADSTFAKDQLTILDEFLELRNQANMLTDFMRSVNQDTSLLKNFGSVLAKEMLIEKVKETAFIPYTKRIDILRKTIVGAFDRAGHTKSMYQDLLHTLTPSVKREIDRIMKDIRPDSKEFEKVYDTLTNDYLGYITQRFGRAYDGKPLYTKMDSLFGGKNSLARRFMDLKAAGKLKSNLLTDELIAQLDENVTSVDNLKLYSRRMTTFEANAFTGAFKELIESKDEDVRAFGRDLVYLGIMQSGLHSSPISFTNLIPYEEYGNIVKKAIEEANMSAQDWAHFEDAFYIKNKGNRSIVPFYSSKRAAKVEKMKYYQVFNGPGVDSTLMVYNAAIDEHIPVNVGKYFGYRMQYYGFGAGTISNPTPRSPLQEAADAPDALRTSPETEEFDAYNEVIEVVEEEEEVVEEVTETGNKQVREGYANPADFTMYSGAAKGSDQEWARLARQYGMNVVEFVVGHIDRLNPTQLAEVEAAYQKAVKALGRRAMSLTDPEKAYSAKLVRRDYLQAKAAQQVYAVGKLEPIVDVSKPKGPNVAGESSQSYRFMPSGGTAYAVQMAMDMKKRIYFFDQKDNTWLTFNYDTNEWMTISWTPRLFTKKVALIGTRELEANGRAAIAQVFHETFEEEEPPFQKEAAGEEMTLDQVTSLIENLQKKFKIQAEIINDKSKMWAGRYMDGVPVINLAYAKSDTPFHEFAHPFVKVVQVNNPDLYKTWRQAVIDEKNVLEKTKVLYPELSAEEQIEEAIVQSLGQYAAGTLKENSNLFKRIKLFFDRLAKLLGVNFARVITPEMLSPKMSLLQMGRMLADKTTEIDLAFISNMSAEARVAKEQYIELMKIKKSLVTSGHIQLSCRR